MLLYIHVPFCRRKCSYCAFNSQVLSKAGLEAYCQALLREIVFWGERLERPEIETLFFGGGTPSLLPIKHLAATLNALAKHFRIAPGLEFSFEGNPESLKAEYLTALRGLGVNRLSIGVQSLHDPLLAALGRSHTARQAKEAYRLARVAGFQNVSLDLMWGLPGQRLKLWLDDLKAIVAMAPEHLSCYGLTVEPGTVLEADCLQNLVALPLEDELSKMFVYGADYLEAAGYLQYEVSNFARMGYACRHNLGYWEGRDYLGLGPSAVSTVAGRRWGNPSGLAAHVRAVEDKTPGSVVEELTPETRAREMIMLRLRTSRGLDLKAWGELTGRDFLRVHAKLVRALRRAELARVSQGHVRLTRNGLLVSNTIIEKFFE